MLEALAGIPFSWRLAALLLLLSAVAGGERWWRGERATRWRDYSALLLAGALGSAFGASFDQVSLALSPDYFELGKGLEPGPDLRWRVTALGAQAGFVAGLIAGGALLVVGRPGREPRLPLARLARQVPAVLLAALALAPLGALLWPRLAPALPLELPEARVAWFRAVWGLHVGLYAGAALGVGLALVRLRRERRAAARPAAAPPGA